MSLVNLCLVLMGASFSVVTGLTTSTFPLVRRGAVFSGSIWWGARKGTAVYSEGEESGIKGADGEEEPLYDVLEAAPSTGTEGYLNTDFKKVGQEKQSRVLAYIVLALVPCLFLVPFFMSRDFVPPTIP